MKLMTKGQWLDAILEVVGDAAGEPELTRLKEMSRRQLAAVEWLLVAVRDNNCTVGCGNCDWCDHQNKKAQAAFAKKNPPPIGKPVTLLPMTAESRKWIAANKAKRSIMLKWNGERLTVRAPNGKQRTFGPREATWTVAT